MRKLIFLIPLFIISIKTVAQKSDQIIATVNGEKITVDEFKKVYEKNLKAIDNDEGKDVAKNLDLYINYKLKVKEAYSLALDTLKSYKREMKTYRNQLIAPYLQDKEYFNRLVKETYERTKKEVRASHILIRLPRNYKEKDTLEAYNKALAARERILKGEPFEKVAREVSEDKSAAVNGGDLGYFSAFKMIYDFESTAYKTPEGHISLPFKTRFGYHILKNNGSRISRGDREVAHILIADTTNVGKTKINEVYDELKKGGDFKALAAKYSNDTGSKDKGGILRRFGTGRMVKPFEDIAFSLKEEGDFSLPFRTRFGWHIVKLIKKYPILSFEEMKKEIEDRLRKSGRIRLSDEAVLNRLKKEYAIIENSEGKIILNRPDIRVIPKDSLQNTILTINSKVIKQEVFVKYIKSKMHLPVEVLFKNFVDSQILTYYKDDLVNTEPDFAFTLKEYEDGLLLFELMQQKIWEKSNDSTLLQNYYNTRKKSYRNKKLSQIRGKVISDYQVYLEKEWIEELRTKNNVEINKKVLKKVIKFYKEQS